jgi:hypothetical protein
MNITITDSRRIETIQQEFNCSFPYLKLEFFSRSHTTGEPTAKKFMRSPDKTIGECRTVHQSGHVTIEPGMTVTELEETFRDLYGLNVQLFRKSGKIWLETSVTDSWTLEEQNRQGETLTRMIG